MRCVFKTAHVKRIECFVSSELAFRSVKASLIIRYEVVSLVNLLSEETFPTKWRPCQDVYRADNRRGG